MIRKVFICTLAAVVACSSSTEPAQDRQLPPGVNPGISIETGAGISDTIGAVQSTALRIVLRDANGNVAASKSVRFTSLGAKSVNVYEPSVLMQTPDSATPRPLVDLTTAADGSAEVGTIMGSASGAGGIVVTTLEAPIYTDTATFLILPGNAVSIASLPADITVVVGHPYSLTAVTRDREGNPRSDQVVYHALGSALTVSASGMVSPVAAARTGVVSTFASLQPDTSWVTIVPAGTMAIRDGSVIKVVGFDGTLVASISAPADSPNPPLPIPGPEWTPDGQALYTLIGTFGSPMVLYQVDMHGTQTLVGTCSFTGCAAPSGSTFVLPGAFESYAPSADGRFIYLSSGTCNYEGILYQAQLGFAGAAERLSPANSDDCFETIHRWPSISPDGTVLAFENDSSYFAGPATFQLLDVATHTIRPLSLAGARPRWSPAGDLIAFVNAQRVWVVNPDGSNLRAVTSSTRLYIPGATWSPDGHWLLAHDGSVAVLVEVATGMELPLPFTAGWADGAGALSIGVWRPGTP